MISYEVNVSKFIKAVGGWRHARDLLRIECGTNLSIWTVRQWGRSGRKIPVRWMITLAYLTNINPIDYAERKGEHNANLGSD